MANKPLDAKEFEPEWLQQSLDRHLVWGLAFMIVLIVGFPVYYLREPSLRRDALAQQKLDYTASGGTRFAQNCSSCHGKNGAGGSTAPTLNSSQFLKDTSDGQVELLISGGVSGTSMTAWSQDFGGPLTAEQVRELVTYLRSLEPSAPSIADWRAGKKAAN